MTTTPTSGAADLPEALKHAEGIESFAEHLPAYGFDSKPLKEAAATIRRLHALLEAEDAAHCNTIEQRDEAEKLGTMLANAVAEHFRVEVGEYSNLNDPRLVALEILGGGYITDSDADRKIAALAAVQATAAQQPGTAYAALTYKQAVGSKNCMQCCVSYMLGLPLESVPDFATDGGWERFSEFVESKGYAAVMLPGNSEFEADYLASGTTERGTSHMVVMNDGKLVHDPHPSNAGLVEVQCVWLLAKRATPRAVHADEQAAFEAVAKADTSNVNFIRDDTGYADMTAALLWHGWKLRASHGQAPAQAAPAAVARPRRATRAVQQLGAGDAVFAFASMLTALPRVVPFGSAAWATPGAELATAFNAANGLSVSLDFPSEIVFPKVDGDLLAVIEKAAAPQPASPSYTHADVLEAHPNGYELGMRQQDRATKPAPAAQGDALDAARLDWLENDVGCRVFHLGKSWYTRANFGMPYRKRASLREAIDAARAAQEGK